jgi:hypothetical protein
MQNTVTTAIQYQQYMQNRQYYTLQYTQYRQNRWYKHFMVLVCFFF